MKEGDEIDLGDRALRAVEPVVRDMRNTWWAAVRGGSVAERGTNEGKFKAVAAE